MLAVDFFKSDFMLYNALLVFIDSQDVPFFGGVGFGVEDFSSLDAGFWITLSFPLVIYGTSSLHTMTRIQRSTRQKWILSTGYMTLISRPKGRFAM